MLNDPKTEADFRQWLRARLDWLDDRRRDVDWDDDGELILMEAASVAREAAVIALRLGNVELFRRCNIGSRYLSICHAQESLGECLASLNEMNESARRRVMSDPPAVMIEREVITYLRLDDDERDPRERLRNLIRYHRLPHTRRGRVSLFRRESVDAWMDAKRQNRN